MVFKKIIVFVTVLALILSFTGCGEGNKNDDDPSGSEAVQEITENENNTASETETDIEEETEDDEQISQLIEDYYNAINNGDRKELLNLFGKRHRKFIKNFRGFKNLGDDPEPYDLGKCAELERTKLNIDKLTSADWGWITDYTEGYSDIKLYLELYDYEPGSAENIYIDVLEGSHYNYFLVGKGNDNWKILNITRPENMTELVDLGMIQYEETINGEMSPLEVQLFSEKYPAVLFDSETGESVPTEYNGFFNSVYDKPENMDFEAFMKCFMPRYPLEPDDEEYANVEKLEKKKHGVGFPEEGLNTPLWKYKREDVDRVLEKYAGITTQDLDTENTKSLLYSKKYDAFYNFTSDASFGFFRPDSGYVEGDVYTFKENETYIPTVDDPCAVLTRFKRIGNDYLIMSREIIE